MRLVIATTLLTAAKDPLHRPVAWLAALLIVTCSATALLVNFTLPSLLLGAAAGALTMAALVVVVGGLAEFAATLHADRLWHHLDPKTQKVRATALTASTRDGEWKLKSVAAWPFRTGSGSELVEAICREADQDGITIRLESSTPRVTSFYRRHGFEPGHRTLAGGHAMTRAPCQTVPREQS